MGSVDFSNNLLIEWYEIKPVLKMKKKKLETAQLIQSMRSNLIVEEKKEKIC